MPRGMFRKMGYKLPKNISLATKAPHLKIN